MTPFSRAVGVICIFIPHSHFGRKTPFPPGVYFGGGGVIVHDGLVEFGSEAVSDLFAVFLSASYGHQETEGEK